MHKIDLFDEIIQHIVTVLCADLLREMSAH